MYRIALLVLAVASSACAQDKPPSELEGEYDLKEFFENGRASDEKGQIRSVTFKDGIMTVKSAARDDAAKFTVETGKTPFQIDLKPMSGEDKTTLGIWKIEKGELVIVFNKKGPRPADFKGLGEGVVKFALAKSIPKVIPKKDK